jgi:type II secretory pathway pseudopilin PulG
MRTRRLQFALTLVDMIIAVAIVALLAGIVLTSLTRIESKSKERLCEGTLETLNTALRQFRNYGYEYKVRITATTNEIEFYRSLKFPPDCNDYTQADVQIEIQKLLDLSILPTIASTTAEQYDPNDSCSAVMYFFLSRVPQCRETLGAIDRSLVKSDHNNDGKYLTIRVDGREYPWLRVVDPWGTSLRYDYYINEQERPVSSLSWARRKDTVRTFPLITSAGPDKQFDTTDDITNRIKTETPVIP